MDWSKELADRIKTEVPLADQTWFKLGGNARYMFSPADTEELSTALKDARDADLNTRILGGGANVLIKDDGYDGLVVRLDQDSFTKVEFDGERVRAGGGADLMKLAHECSQRGLSGLETLAGIPGTVGGATVMNAGGRYGQFSDVVESVELMTREGTKYELPAEEMGFGYRHSNVGDDIVTGAVLRLRKKTREETIERYREIWESKKNSQPFAKHSAGCIFKNPPGDSAGRLIDSVGLKGVTLGAASVSEVHANFITADDEATAGDVLRLAMLVRDTVFEQTGVKLELEIDVW